MPDYYLEVVDDGHSIEEHFWSVDSMVAHRDITPSQIGTHKHVAGEDILVTLQGRYPSSKFCKLQLAPGEYFPRMSRPQTTRPECSPGHNPDNSAPALTVRTISTGQLHALILELQKICMVVHPAEANFSAYGHEIRNILVISSMEVEAHWRNILKANGKKAGSTREYVKLGPAMKLGEYRVALTWYPWLEPVAPFEKWRPSTTPSKDLSWYDAYNAVKHDRENNFARATLINALNAVAGCFVMLCAQYGWGFAKSGEAATDAFFRLIAAPKWEPSEIYVPPIGASPTERCYSF